LSAVPERPFLVIGFDYDVWRIVVDAASLDDAIQKAKAIYLTDGFDNTDAFALHSSFVEWRADPLAREAH
jgi:hypothetical protein